MNKDNQESTTFKYGDLIQECSCGEVYKTSYKRVEGGIQIILPTSSNRDVFKLVCPKCKHTMELYFIASENQEDDKEEVKETKDEPTSNEKDKETKSV